MDFYKSMDDLKNYFIKFLEKVPSFGKAFICIDDDINRNLIKKLKNKNYFTYGINHKSNFLIQNINHKKDFTEFDILINVPNKKTKNKKIKIPLIGLHNVRNSVAAAAIAITVGISIKEIKDGLSKFKGVQRRFNKIFTFNDVDFFDDYAHHPTEIKTVLESVNKVYRGYDKSLCISTS